MRRLFRSSRSSRLPRLLPAFVAALLSACGSDAGVIDLGPPPDGASPADLAVPPLDAVAVPADAAAPRGDGAVPPAFEACVLHTLDLPQCKDCCDCAPISCTELTPCRNACKDHDFRGNSGFVDMLIPSTMGMSGDYTACVKENATPQACKTCCECQKGFACGDFRFCRTLCDTSY